MPAPSPVFTSQPHAPRCRRFTETSNACRTSLCDRSPLMFTTNPTPHESCSKRGSYSPSARGIVPAGRAVGHEFCMVAFIVRDPE